MGWHGGLLLGAGAAARQGGFRAVLFRTGRHIAQEPRSWLELPDAEVWDVHALSLALDDLLEG